MSKWLAKFQCAAQPTPTIPTQALNLAPTVGIVGSVGKTGERDGFASVGNVGVGTGAVPEIYSDRNLVCNNCSSVGRKKMTAETHIWCINCGWLTVIEYQASECSVCCAMRQIDKCLLAEVVV